MIDYQKPPTYAYGLVVGKFDPFHLGHKFLIERALQDAGEVHVLIVTSHLDACSLNSRLDWICNEFPEKPNLYVSWIDDLYDDDNSAAWAEHTLKWFMHNAPWVEPAQLVVFSSETYGPEYARLMGGQHVMVDPQRQMIPVSATNIREDLFGYWGFVPQSVRPELGIKITVMGPESSGTTTMAQWLAYHYCDVCVPEYGRIFCESIYDIQTYQWTTADFEHIAMMQRIMETNLMQRSSAIAVCDTDVLTTTIFHQMYLDKPAPKKMLIDYRPADIYFITAADFKFVQDGTRKEHIVRNDMYDQMFTAATKYTDHVYGLYGDHDSRTHEAITIINDAIESILSKRLTRQTV